MKVKIDGVRFIGVSKTALEVKYTVKEKDISGDIILLPKEIEKDTLKVSE